MWASTSPVLSWDGAESGSSCNIEDTWSWRPQKIAWTVNSIGSFILDISVVADQNAFSHPVTWDIASQSFGSSWRAQRSWLHPTKLSISLAKSKAQPEDDEESINIHQNNLKHWHMHHLMGPGPSCAYIRINIKDCWCVGPFQPHSDASSWLNQACLHCGLDLMAQMILCSWKRH